MNTEPLPGQPIDVDVSNSGRSNSGRSDSGRSDFGESHPDLAERADALERAADLARDRLDPVAVETAVATAAKVRSRLRHGTDRTVVAFAGPTGAGKSSLFNAIVGSEVSTPGVKRPTTSVAHAALWGGDEPRLLRWLDVPRRFLVERPPGADGGEPVADAGVLDGLIVIDLPDVDSVETSNRLEAERLIDVVDALVWVLDPQKYADEVVHAHITGLRQHAAVMRFVVTKIDLVPEQERPALIADLRRRLADDGIAEPVIWGVSVPPGEPSADQEPSPGLAEMGAGLAELVSSQRALVGRLDGDLRLAASALGDGGGAVTVSPERLRDAALDEVSAAAKGDELAEAVALQYRRQARRATGWLPMEWVRRRRPNPAIAVARADNVDRLRIESALRAAAETATVDVGAPWDRIVRREVMGRSDDVADALRTRAVNVARHVGNPPRWWSLFSWLQRALLAAAVVGIAWLGAVAVAGGLGLDTEPLIIKIGPTPIPSALVIGGIGLGIILGVLARLPANVGGKRRARAARREMRAETSRVLDREVVQPIEHVLADRAEIDRLVSIAAGSVA